MTNCMICSKLPFIRRKKISAELIVAEFSGVSDASPSFQLDGNSTYIATCYFQNFSYSMNMSSDKIKKITGEYKNVTFVVITARNYN